MKRILFVCLGNICRSPVGEGIMLHLIKEHKLEGHLSVDSAATSDYHTGEPPDHRTVGNAKKNGVDISALKARQFKKEDFNLFDHIYVMDESNYKNVIKMASKQEQKAKVDYLLNIIQAGKNLAVPDPYYGTEKDFEEVFQLVLKACQKICEPYLAERQ